MSEVHTTPGRGIARSALLRTGGALVLAAGFAFAGATAANAVVKTAYASPGGTGGACSKVQPCSASTAVATATPNTRILLSAGTYDTQLTVATSGLTIQGKGVVVIEPTSVTANATKTDEVTPVDAIVAVAPGTTGVTIANVTIDGSQAGFPACSGTSFSGVEFHDASGSLSHVTVQHTQPADGITGCQVGDAIYVGSGEATANVSMTNVTVSSYNKNGITCKGPGTTCTISSAIVTGTPTAAIAQNGIQFSQDASGSINKATVSHDTNLTDCGCASGILIYQANSNVTVTNSKVTTSDNNIYVYESTAFSISTTSSTKSTLSDGLTLDNVDGVVVTGGSFSSNAGNGIGAYGATNAQISGTTTSKNLASGIYLDGSDGDATGNTVSSNTVKSNDAQGIWANTGANANSFQSNTMRHNSPDAQDNGSGNSWSGNDCVTSSPNAGLCS
jgi:Right handed beta helix region